VRFPSDFRTTEYLANPSTRSVSVDVPSGDVGSRGFHTVFGSLVSKAARGVTYFFNVFFSPLPLIFVPLQRADSFPLPLLGLFQHSQLGAFPFAGYDGPPGRPRFSVAMRLFRLSLVYNAVFPSAPYLVTAVSETRGSCWEEVGALSFFLSS